MKTRAIATSITTTRTTTTKTRTVTRTISPDRDFLSVVLHPDDLKTDVRWHFSSQGGYYSARSSKSRITVRKRNSYPRSFISYNGRGIFFGYVEPATYQQLEEAIKNSKADAFLRQLHRSPITEFCVGHLDMAQRELVVYRDHLCTLPLFYAATDKLYLSNRFESLVTATVLGERVSVNLRVLGETLLVLHQFEETEVEPIKRFTERAVLRYNDSGALRRTLPQPWPARPKERPLDNPLAPFSQLLEQRLHYFHTKVKPARIGFEVSGGLDSVTAPIYYTSIGVKAPAYSMQLGHGQDAKLSQIERKLGEAIKKVSINYAWPLKDQSRALRLFWPRSEIYSLALSKMIEAAKADKTEVIFTGIGGDELFLIDKREISGFSREEEVSYRRDKLQAVPFYTEAFRKSYLPCTANLPTLPTPVIPYSVLDANFSRNNFFIQRDIWPVAPLADHELVEFCRALPKEWRRGKKLMRLYHQDRRYPPSIYAAKINENFGAFFNSSLRRRGTSLLHRLLRQSYLAQLGWIDRQAVMESFRRYRQHEIAVKGLYFYTLCSAEILLQSLRRVFQRVEFEKC